MNEVGESEHTVWPNMSMICRTWELLTPALCRRSMREDAHTPIMWTMGRHGLAATLPRFPDITTWPFEEDNMDRGNKQNTSLRSKRGMLFVLNSRHVGGAKPYIVLDNNTILTHVVQRQTKVCRDLIVYCAISSQIDLAAREEQPVSMCKCRSTPMR